MGSCEITRNESNLVVFVEDWPDVQGGRRPKLNAASLTVRLLMWILSAPEGDARLGQACKALFLPV
jgi:hypothetical protein